MTGHTLNDGGGASVNGGGLVERVRQIDQTTSQHADQLAAVWKDLTHQLNAIQGLLTREQEYVRCLAGTEVTGQQLAARVLAVEAAVEALIHPPAPPALTSVSPHNWSDADRRRLEDQGLFVAGTARSGTTILYETLNESPDVYMLSEAMLFEEAGRPDFIDFHHRRHELYHNRKHKGHYLPRGLTAAENGFDLLRRLAERYRYVGEKVAFGPWHVREHGPNVFDRFLGFHATHFFHSRYVLIVRRPVVSVASMARLWGEFRIPQLLTTWAVGFRVGVELAFTFPRVWTLAHEWLNEETATQLGRELGLDITVPAGRFDREFQRTADAADRLPPRLAPYRANLDALTDLYEEWTAAFSPTTFRYIHRTASREFGQRLCDRADELIEQFATLEEVGRQAG